MKPLRTLKDCFGTWRAVPSDMVMDCPDCNGAGCVTNRHFSGDPQLESEVTCSRCGGEGEVPEEREDGEVPDFD